MFTLICRPTKNNGTHPLHILIYAFFSFYQISLLFWLFLIFSIYVIEMFCWKSWRVRRDRIIRSGRNEIKMIALRSTQQIQSVSMDLSLENDLQMRFFSFKVESITLRNDFFENKIVFCFFFERWLLTKFSFFIF